MPSAKPMTDYSAVSRGLDEAPVVVGSPYAGSNPKNSVTPKSHNADAFVQTARFGGR